MASYNAINIPSRARISIDIDGNFLMITYLEEEKGGGASWDRRIAHCWHARWPCPDIVKLHRISTPFHDVWVPGKGMILRMIWTILERQWKHLVGIIPGRPRAPVHLRSHYCNMLSPSWRARRPFLSQPDLSIRVELWTFALDDLNSSSQA